MIEWFAVGLILLGGLLGVCFLKLIYCVAFVWFDFGCVVCTYCCTCIEQLFLLV